MRERAKETLKKYWGYDSFRPGQEEIVNAALEGRDVLAILPTGGGKSVCFQVPAMIREGIAWVTEDRRHEGVCLSMSVKNNIGLPIYRQISRMGIINDKQLDEIVEKYIAQLAIKTAGSDSLAETLSGGNQQKVVLSKWLASEPKLLILDEPTRGIDVGSKSEIHQLIRKLRDQGMAILVISSEIPELFSLADRILVMRNGELTGEAIRQEKETITEEKIMRLATLGG